MKPKSLPARIWIGLGALWFVAGCADSAASKALLASYSVTISTMGKSDPDVMTVEQAMSGKILLLFNAGITTDPMGPNATGIRATLSGATVTIDAQPVHVDHSTGTIDGSLTGSGSLTQEGMAGLTLHLAPTNFAIPTPGATTLDYEVAGTRE